MTLPKNDPRLQTEKNIWIATVRPDGRPHLVPVWFAWYEGRFFICIAAKSVKAKNITENASVVLSFENGSSPVICEGAAAKVDAPWPGPIGDIFQEKYDWNIFTDKDYDLLLEITPQKWLNW